MDDDGDRSDIGNGCGLEHRGNMGVVLLYVKVNMQHQKRANVRTFVVTEARGADKGVGVAVAFFDHLEPGKRNPQENSSPHK